MFNVEVEEPEHENAVEVKAESDMQVVDDVDVVLSDHGSHFSHGSNYDRFSRSPSFTESMSGSFSVTLSSFSGSASSLGKAMFTMMFHFRNCTNLLFCLHD